MTWLLLNMATNRQRPTALITGATSGIGYELAKVFAHEGYDLVLVAPNAERLLQRAGELNVGYGVTVTVVPANLELPTAPVEIYRELEGHGVRVDVLVNNAGFAVHGYFAATDWLEELGMISVNVVSLTRLTKLFLRDMLSRGRGRILNVASTAAFQPGPLMAVYYATKAYVLSLSQALHEELRGSGVTVTALCPGPTRSNFARRANAHHTRLFRGRVGDPARVARAGFRGLIRGRRLVVPGLGSKFGVWLTRVLPRALVCRAVAFLHRADPW